MEDRMNVGEICTQEVVMADRANTLQQAAAQMREHHVGALLVVGSSGDGMQAVGIVTDRDIVIEAVARGLDMRLTEIGRLAEGKLATVRAGATLDQAITLMKERGVRRLLVSADDGQLYGIVSLDDLLDALSHEMAELAHAVRKGISRETAERVPILAAAPQPRAVRIPAFAYA
jgi:CBS domain-containing protein